MNPDGLTGWLFQTWLASAGLIALVLAVRGAMARRFGARIAYGLWALPLLRLGLPPIVLPAWLAPPVEGAAGTPPVTIVVMDQAAPAEAGFDWTGAGLTLWLGGALGLLAWRVVTYRAMRRRLLADARPVGFAGRVRLVETPAVHAPVAFGVADKVVALPPGFMAWPDRTGRDLVIAHELAHHAGHDLLANFAAQAVLALHWFDPLAWIGWRAMRRDQEAACDARVLAGRDRATRAAYGRLVASFATGGRMALAAPMAGPQMFGERSILHRLRSLTMNEPDGKQRRLGRVLLGAAVLALPATASISRAAPEAPPAPPAPIAREAAPAAPAVPPVPAAGEAHKVVKRIVILHKPRQDGVALKTRTVVRNGATVTISSDQDIDDAELERRLAELDVQAPEPPVPPVPPVAGTQRRFIVGYGHRGDDGAVRVQKRIVILDGDEMPPEAMAEIGRMRGNVEALAAIRAARDDVARDAGIPAEVKEKVLRKLDARIEALGKKG